MDKVFFGQRAEEEENMSCTRALQSMSWSEACQRYFKVLEFGDEMNADLLAQVMGCDVKTGRKRGRTRCWTQAELLARKESVSSRTSTPQSNRKKSKKFHAYKYVVFERVTYTTLTLLTLSYPSLAIIPREYSITNTQTQVRLVGREESESEHQSRGDRSMGIVGETRIHRCEHSCMCAYEHECLGWNQNV